MSHIDYNELARACAAVPLPPGIAVRAWAAPDYPAVRDLAAAEGWTTLRDRPDDALRAWQHSWPALVATRDDVIIGFLRALTDGAVTLYVADVLVAPAWRGQGIATALFAVGHALYPSTRFDLLSLETAQGFYQQQGFHPFAGFRKSYW